MRFMKHPDDQQTRDMWGYKIDDHVYHERLSCVFKIVGTNNNRLTAIRDGAAYPVAIDFNAVRIASAEEVKMDKHKYA